MKTILILAATLIMLFDKAYAQMITFEEFPFTSYTAITNQYLNKGVVFEGENGAPPPMIYDYADISLPYGRALHGGGWIHPMRISFVDSLNPSKYNPVSVIDFVNATDSNVINNSEVDFMSINVYDSSNVLIYHYLSHSPEHVVINIGSPSIAYVVMQDSANTSFILDNLRMNYSKYISIKDEEKEMSKTFPNPFSNELNIQLSNNINAEITILDILSREVFNSSFNSSIKVDTENFESGTYFYQVIDENGSISKGKVIKQ